MKIVKKSLPAIATLAAIISTQLMAAPEVINIARPNGNGVSMNNHASFNVGAEGLVLNNSAAASANTKLAGVVSANRNLRYTPAKVIINQVKAGGAASNLMGVIEVAGKKADVYIANPAGINCSGCGFINTDRAILTSGTITNVKTNAVKLGSGTVSFEGAGLSSGEAVNLEVNSKKVQINAPVYAKSLKANISNDDWDYYAIDVTSLGSVVADSIYLVGKKEGMGVNNEGVIDARKNMQITNSGRVVNKGTIAASVIRIDRTDRVTNSGEMLADSDLTIFAKKIDNQSEGLMLSDKNMVLKGHNELVNNGTISAEFGSSYLDSKSIDNSGDIVGDNLTLHLQPQGKVKNSGTIVTRVLTTEGFSASKLNSDGGKVTADRINTGIFF